MKRSQMIQALEYLISTSHPKEFPSAEDILNCVEENGMLPPEFLYFNIDDHGKLQYSQLNNEYINRWEKE